jgi:hypothetical protein
MLVKVELLEKDTKKNIRDLTERFMGEIKQGTGLNEIIPEILRDKDLFIYMAKASIKDSGIRLGHMEYWDDVTVRVTYGLNYNFEKPSLNIFTFKSTPGYPPNEEPIKSLELHSSLPSSNSIETFSGYPSPEKFVSSLNEILRKPIKEQRPYWIDFNKEYLH